MDITTVFHYGKSVYSNLFDSIYTKNVNMESYFKANFHIENVTNTNNETSHILYEKEVSFSVKMYKGNKVRKLSTLDIFKSFESSCTSHQNNKIHVHLTQIYISAITLF